MTTNEPKPTITCPVCGSENVETINIKGTKDFPITGEDRFRIRPWAIHKCRVCGHVWRTRPDQAK